MTGDYHFLPVITSQGMQAITHAIESDSFVQVTQVALGDVGWTPTSDATRLQNERQRVAITGSRCLDDNRYHITSVVGGSDAYWVNELGMLLADGTLLAIWSHEEHALAWKAVNVDLILNFELILAALPCERLVIDMNGEFNLAPATVSQQGLVRLATDAEALAGGLSEAVVLTPASCCLQGDARYAQQAGDYADLRARATTKADVGLSNVPNYSCTSSVSDTSNSKLATAGAVKKAYDHVNNQRLVWGPTQLASFVEGEIFDPENPGYVALYTHEYNVPDNCMVVGIIYAYNAAVSYGQYHFYKIKYQQLNLE